MKTLTTVVLATLAAHSFAGQEIAPPSASSKGVVDPAEPAFGEVELQVDAYGTYVDAGSSDGDGFGGGLAINYFFHRNFGLSLDTNASEGDSDTVWQHSVGLIGRYPFELNGVFLSPYFKIAGGIQSQDGTDAFLALGGGLEWRVNPHLGLFTEATYGFVQDDADFVNIRAGVRFVF